MGYSYSRIGKDGLSVGIVDNNGNVISKLGSTPDLTILFGDEIMLNNLETVFETLQDSEETKAYKDILDNLHELTVESMEDLVNDIEDRIGNALTPPKSEASVPVEAPEDNLVKGEDTYKQGELQDDGSVSYENEPTITIHLDTADFEEKLNNVVKTLKEIKEDETFDNLFGKALSPKPVPQPLRLHEQLDKKRLDKIESDIYDIKNEIESNKIATDNDVTKLKAELANAVRDIASNASDIALLKEYVL